jgi:AraC-like DNA-binding protein
MGMENLDEWLRFVTLRVNAPPLTFLNGLRHSVKCKFHGARHSHPGIEIVYHPTGKGITRVGRKQAVAFEAGSVVVYAPFEEHDQSMEVDGEDLCLRIAFPRGVPGAPRRCFYVPALEEPTIIGDMRILSGSQACLDLTEQAIFNLRATSTLYALVRLASLQRDGNECSVAERYVREAERHIRDHFASIESVCEVARAVGISHDHLRHVFRSQRRRNLVQYLSEVRIDRARTLLVHSRIPLKQISRMCGFNDEFYFSAVFRRIVGIPPGQYRTSRTGLERRSR